MTVTSGGFVVDSHTVNVPASGSATQTFALTQGLASGQTRIVLTWGNDPRDLDSHLWVPTPGQATEIYYQSRGNLTGPPYANLDVDDTNGLGPETVTIGRLQPGQYVYAVHLYAGDGTLPTSGARVVVYQGNSVVQTFTAPSGSGRWWYVFTMDGTSGAISPVNQIANSPPSASGGPGGGAVGPSGACTWTGAWTTNADFKSVGSITMTLTQTGNIVSGTYSYNQGRIQGQVNGLGLRGQWLEAPTYQAPSNGGDLELTLTPDCNSFTGRFYQRLTAMPPGSDGWWQWAGTRGAGAAPGPGPGGGGAVVSGTTLQVGQNVVGRLDRWDERDTYWIDFQSTQPILLSMRATSGALSPSIWVYDQGGNLVGQNNENPARLRLGELPSGRYRVEAGNARNVSTAVGEYLLCVTTTR